MWEQGAGISALRSQTRRSPGAGQDISTLERLIDIGNSMKTISHGKYFHTVLYGFVSIPVNANERPAWEWVLPPSTGLVSGVFIAVLTIIQGVCSFI